MSATPLPIETLRATYTREKPYHPDWPETFDQAMADPYVRACIDLRARHNVLTFGRRRADRAKVTGQGSLIETQGGFDYTRQERQPTMPSSLPPLVQPKRPGLDWKRKAAGERDED